MKWIPLFLSACLCAQAAPTDPGKTAVDFLEKIRTGKLSLAPGADTAISPRVSDGKREEIELRIRKIAKDIGEGALEIGPVRESSGYAGVLVRKNHGFDASNLQVFPIALIKRGENWIPAPVAASFENTGVPYEPELRKRLDELEMWMLREQVIDLEKLRLESRERMHQEIQKSLPLEHLRAMEPGLIARNFVDACQRRDHAAMLGYLGGLRTDLPSDWAARLSSVTEAISNKTNPVSAWRQLMSPEVVRAIVDEEIDDDAGLVSYVCLDPAGKPGDATATPQFHVLHLELTKSEEGLWQIDLPSAFLDADEELETDLDQDADLIDAFPEAVHDTTPLTPQASPEEAQATLIRALKGNNPSAVFAILALGPDEKSARSACITAARYWWLFHDPATVRELLPLAFRNNTDTAAAIAQFFTAREPGRADLRTLYFSKSDQGWLWTPSPVAGELRQWSADESKKWTNNWQPRILEESIALKSLGAFPAPDAEAARKLMTEWIAATKAGDVRRVLALTAWLESPTAILRNLGPEISSARRPGQTAEIRTIASSATFAAAGIETRLGNSTTSPLYPIVQTEKGPRVLLEIDLFASVNRAREFLNKTSLDRLQAATSPAVADELRGLLADYQKSLVK